MRRSFIVRLGVLALAATLLAGCTPAEEEPLGTVGEFALTERSGRTVRSSDLAGKVWVAAFTFTRCAGACNQVSGTMARLHQELANEPDLVLVSFTVDPTYDTPEVLRAYARRFDADPDRWLFLTGEQEEVYDLILNHFQLGVQQNKGKERTPGNEVTHSNRLVLVDREGRIRGHFDGAPRQDVEQEFAKLRRATLAQLRGGSWAWTQDLPTVNALLNGTSALLLILGYLAIRRRKVGLHQTCMLLALAVSALFLVSYLYFHMVVRGGEPTRFTDRAPYAPDWVRYTYYVVLWTHTPLAVVATPLAIYTAYLGLRGLLKRHVWIARWTLPLWLYVSLTGVVVYWMLYQLYPAP